jgi:hypothetical protein
MSFSGTIEIKDLRTQDVTGSIARQITELLKYQDERAHHVTPEDLRRHLKSMYIVLAFSEDRAIGMIDAPLLQPLSHGVGSIHNPIVLEGFDVLTTKKRLFERILVLTPGPLYQYIDYTARRDDPEMCAMLRDLGFKPRTNKVIYRIDRSAE